MRSSSMFFRGILFFALASIVAAGPVLRADGPTEQDSGLLTKQLGLIEATVREGIRKKELPGAVVPDRT